MNFYFAVYVIELTSVSDVMVVCIYCPSLKRFQKKTAGLVVSRSQSQRSVGMPAVASAASSASVRIIAHPADAADDSFGGESDDIRSLPEDVKRSDVRVIIPRAISQGNDSGYDSDDDSDDSSVVLPEGDKAGMLLLVDVGGEKRTSTSLFTSLC